MKEIIKLSMAKSLGLKRYFTGKPCLMGHVSERSVGNRQCCDCATVRRSKLTREQKDKYNKKNRERYLANPEKYKKESQEKRKRQEERQPGLLKKQAKEYAIKNKEKLKELNAKYKEKNRQKINELQIKYTKRHRLEISKRKRHRYANDPVYALSVLCRSHVWYALKRLELKKPTKTEIMLGCSIIDLKKHIESKFKPGMTWENRGEWEIDHIIPLSSAKNMEELNPLLNYQNLQPLWRSENRKKSKKLPHQLV